MTITINKDQYEALSSLALQGATDENSKFRVAKFLEEIEKANDLKRYFLNIRWQEARSRMPPTETFPRVWPPELSGNLTRFDRPIAKSDVTTYVNAQATAPVGIMVTSDHAGTYGWSKIDDYFRG
jgi:hypothetical protein